jgi:hypothetical protein
VTGHEKPGGAPAAGLDGKWDGLKLDHAQHDCADKGESDIGGENAQSADECHANASLLNAAAL